METKAEQYYPTYKAEHRDILLLEFEEAQKIANGQNKVYAQVTNILLVIATFSLTSIVDIDEKKVKALSFVSSNAVLFSIIIFIFGAILLRYFVDLQRQITINARKVVTLRTLLGLDYGSINLTLPNWRVEGATNPFVIKYFNGWLSFKSMPFWLVTLMVNLLWWFTIADKPAIMFNIFNHPFFISWKWGHLIIAVTYLLIFRRNLNDRHETLYLSLVKFMFFVFRIKFIDNIEYTLYRAKLSFLELDRLKVNYQKLPKILVEIEDNDFYSNVGISFKSLLRGILSRFKFLRKRFGYAQHGGSTLTMQLTRSLFISSTQNKYLRKIGELLLAPWLNNQFSKADILKLYISSVRYDRGVLGLANAVKHYFGELKEKNISDEESFFLVERLSNVTSSVNWIRIESLLKRIRTNLNHETLIAIYNTQINKGTLK